jgi:hypothetical protein
MIQQATRIMQEELRVLEGDLLDARKNYLDLLTDEARGYENIANTLGRSIDQLSEYRKGLFIGTDSPFGLAEQQQILAGRQTGLVDRAMSGDWDAINELLSVNQDYLSVSKQMSGDWRDYAREVAKSAHLMASLEDIAQGELSEAEKQIAALRSIIDEVEGVSNRITDLDEARSIYEQAKEALDSSWMTEELANLENVFGVTQNIEGLLENIYEIDNELKNLLGDSYEQIITGNQTIADNLAELAEIETKITNIINNDIEFTLPPININVIVDTLEKSIEVDVVEGIESIIESVRTTSTFWSRSSHGAYGYEWFPGDTGAASGGVFTGPHTGYPMTLHGTEAVVPLPDGQSIPVDMRGADNSELINEIRKLREEMRLNRMTTESVAEHTSDTAGILGRWQREGLPVGENGALEVI